MPYTTTYTLKNGEFMNEDLERIFVTCAYTCGRESLSEMQPTLILSLGMLVSIGALDP